MKISKILLFCAIALVLSSASFAVPAKPAAAADPYITLSDDEGYVGDSIRVRGYNFTSTSGYTIYFDDEEVVSSFTISSGSFSKTFDVPAMSRDDHEIIVYDKNDDEVTSETYTIDSKISINDTSFFVGDRVTVSGTGFADGKTIWIYLDGDDELETTKSKSSGSFSSTSFYLPETYAGSHYISAEDTGGSAQVKITVSPQITIDTTSAAVGDTLTLSATGFSKSTTVTFSIDGEELDQSAKTDSTGTFEDTDIVLPVISGGSHTIKATDSKGYYATGTIVITQAVSISPVKGSPGTAIEVSGEGFGTNKTISISLAGITIGTGETDSTGYFVANATIPGLPARSYSIEISDGTRESTADFTVTSGASLSQDSGTVGSEITVNGKGFEIERSVIITFDGASLGSSTTDLNGEFSYNATIPAATAGEHVIIISDNISSVTLPFMVVAGSTTAVGGNIGESITINGYAYTPGAAITVKYDSTQLTTAKADTTGSFSVNIKIPASKGGEHKITISDGTSTTTNVFTVETKAPPVPALISPVDLAKSSGKAVLSWEAVTDPSGVTYRLQISDDANFSNILVDASGITETTYTLTEKLKMAGSKAPYYWRIKAIDGASNESAWSAVQTFTVGLPGWAFALIIIGGLIVLTGLYLIWNNLIRKRYRY